MESISNENLYVQSLFTHEQLPYDLLLLADEEMEAIKRYIFRSEVYLVRHIGISDPIGAFALFEQDDKTVEIKNIAVIESFQGLGVGSYMLTCIQQLASRKNYSEIIVGTADKGIMEIAFYEKNNFRQYGVRENFFLENYERPIFENGAMLKDMVMFKKAI